MAESDGFVRITLRIPEGLHTALVEASAKKRSMNAEIIQRLEATFHRSDHVPLADGTPMYVALRMLADELEQKAKEAPAR